MRRTLSQGLSGHARHVTALVLARFSRTMDIRQMDRWLQCLPMWRRWQMIGLVLGLLLALAIGAAAFGAVGLALYFATAVLVFRPR